jgi:hypothetical protein
MRPIFQILTRLPKEIIFSRGLNLSTVGAILSRSSSKKCSKGTRPAWAGFKTAEEGRAKI